MQGGREAKGPSPDNEAAVSSPTWRAEPREVASWEEQLTAMTLEVKDLTSRGLWRSGGRTLLRALWLHHSEIFLCRGLAWLLAPDGWHGLGSSLLDRFLDRLDAPAGDVGAVTITTEEQRGDTRGDIVIRTNVHCVLVEAKVWAGEQENQAHRLAERWADESPVLVFLTRDGRSPATAATGQAEWHGVSWSQLADLLEASIAVSPGCSAGAREYLETLRWYGGTV